MGRDIMGTKQATGRTTTTKAIKPRRNAAAPKLAGDKLLDELRDWHARAMALPFDSLGRADKTPEYFANFNVRAVAMMVGFHVQHVEGWSKLSPKCAPRGIEIGFSFAPGMVHETGRISPPKIALALHERPPVPEEWSAQEMAILLRAKAKANEARAKREGDKLFRDWAKNDARRAGSGAKFAAAWAAREKAEHAKTMARIDALRSKKLEGSK